MSKTSVIKFILGTILFTLLSVSFVKSSFDVLEGRDRLYEVREDVEELEKQKEQIKEGIEYKKSDEYVEEKARNELNLIKPGEKVYVVMGGESSHNNVLSESDFNSEDIAKTSNWYLWYRLFFED